MADVKTKSPLAVLVAPPLLAGAVAVGAAAPLAASAQNILMQLEGIEGEATAEKYKGWIDILSYTQAFRNATSGSGGGSGKGQAVCGAVTVLKNIDKSSPVLIKQTIQGKHVPKGAIVFRSAGGLAQEYYRVTLYEIFFTAIDQTDAQDASRVVERVTMQPTRFDFEYTPQDEKGGTGGVVRVSYNCKTTEVF